MNSPRIGPPDTEEVPPHTSADPGLSVSAVARRLGVAPPTLRTWDRRYGLGPSEHEAGSHRRYTTSDVARLLIMRRLTLEGTAPGDAARAAKAATDAELAREHAIGLSGNADTRGEQVDDPLNGVNKDIASLPDDEGSLGAPITSAPKTGAPVTVPQETTPQGTTPLGGATRGAGEHGVPGVPGPRGPAQPEALRAAAQGTAPTGTAPTGTVGPRAAGRVERGAEQGAGGRSAEQGASEPTTNEKFPPFLQPVPSLGKTPITAVPSADRPITPRPASVSDVVDAAIAYDQRTCDRLLRLSLDVDPVDWWMDLVEPAVRRLAERTVLAWPGEVPEVILANAALAALRDYDQLGEDAMVRAGGPPRTHPSRMRRIVLIFAAPGEPIPLTAHVLAAALGAHGAMARIVTGPASTHRTLELITMVRPAAVAMVTRQERPDLRVVRDLHEANPQLPLFVGLASDDVVEDIPLALTVQRVRSFPGLLHELLAVVKEPSRT